jgi:NAD-dependent deacetylase
MPHVAPFADFAPLPIARGARIFILTGAGISAESGIRTFRDAGGLWDNHRFEEVASPEGWAEHPEIVWRFYAQRRAQASTCGPNAAHHALAALERAIGDHLFLCTQNVDDLHEAAGSTRVVHMHGELMKSRCESSPSPSVASERTPSRTEASRCSLPPFEDRTPHKSIPACACGARIRPHIVWFGEVPFELERIARELDLCDVFVTIGSSGAVYPAAGFVSAVRARASRGGRPVRTVYVGPEEPDNARMFDECRLGKAGDVVPGLFLSAAGT